MALPTLSCQARHRGCGPRWLCSEGGAFLPQRPVWLPGPSLSHLASFVSSVLVLEGRRESGGGHRITHPFCARSAAGCLAHQPCPFPPHTLAEAHRPGERVSWPQTWAEPHSEAQVLPLLRAAHSHCIPWQAGFRETLAPHSRKAEKPGMEAVAREGLGRAGRAREAPREPRLQSLLGVLAPPWPALPPSWESPSPTPPGELRPCLSAWGSARPGPLLLDPSALTLSQPDRQVPPKLSALPANSF